MRQYLKYLQGSSIISLAEQVVASVLALGNDGIQSDHGFGNVYKWRSLPVGFKEAKVSEKPIFLVVHKLTCPACIKLKEKFSRSIKLIELSPHFVMINVESGSDLLPNNDNFVPDGKYVPRILFFTPKGELIRNAYNRHPDADKDHRYFYSSPLQIVEVMQQVINNPGRNPLPEPRKN